MVIVGETRAGEARRSEISARKSIPRSGDGGGSTWGGGELRQPSPARYTTANTAQGAAWKRRPPPRAESDFRAAPSPVMRLRTYPRATPVTSTAGMAVLRSLRSGRLHVEEGPIEGGTQPGAVF